MKALRVNRIKAFFRRYRSSKRVAVQSMYNGDLNTYLNTSIELSKTKQEVKNELTPLVYRTN